MLVYHYTIDFIIRPSSFFLYDGTTNFFSFSLFCLLLSCWVNNKRHQHRAVPIAIFNMPTTHNKLQFYVCAYTYSNCIVRFIFLGLVTFLVTSHLFAFSHDKLNFLSGLFLLLLTFFSSRVTCSQLFHIMVRCFVGWVILGAKFSICWFLRSFLKKIKSKALYFSPRAFLALKEIIHFDFMENSIIKMQKKISKNLNFKFLDLFRNFWTCKNVYYASSFSRRILKFIKLYKTNRNLLIP